MNRKALPTLLLLLSMSGILFAQKGIGTNNPNEETALHISSHNKGVLIPSVSLTDSSTFSPPISGTSSSSHNGLLVWNNNTTTNNGLAGTGYYFWQNSTTSGLGNWYKLNSTEDGALPASGTVTNSTLRWDGSDWVEATTLLSSPTGVSVSVSSTLATTTLTASLHDYSGSAGEAGLFLSSTGTGTLWKALSTLSDTDTDTKIQLEEGPDEDIIRFDTNGEERMIISNNGRVGIGTTAPFRQFHISDNGVNNNARVYLEATDGLTGPGIEFSFDNVGNERGLVRLNQEGSNGTNFAFYTKEDGSGLAEKMRLSHDGNLGLGTTSPAHTLTVNGSAQVVGALHDSSGDAGTARQILSTTGTRTDWVSLASSFTDEDEDTKIQIEEGPDDDTIRFDAAGIEVATVNSSTFILYNTAQPTVAKSTESHAAVTSSFVTIADISTWRTSSIDLRSMTIAPSSVNSGVHLLANANTTTIGIVVSDATPLVGNLATAYWIYSLDAGIRIRMIRAEFQLSGNDLQVRYTSRRFVGVTSVPPANQTDAYLSTAGSPSSGTTLPEVVIEYHPLAAALDSFFVADASTARVGINTANPAHSLQVNGAAQVSGALHDSSGDAGTAGQVLSSTGTQTNWIDASGSFSSGTVTHSTLGWDGTDWVENTALLSDGANTTTLTTEFMVQGNSTLATTTINNALVDASGNVGTAGQVLSSTGTSTQWLDNTPLASGTVTNSTLRWDGSDWVESTTLLQTDAATGSATIAANTTVTGTLAVTNSATLSNELTVLGSSTLATTTINNDLTVVGSSTLATTTLGAALLDYGLDAGIAGQVLTSTSTSTRWASFSSISDTDTDTKITVEESNDEDRIRFATVGAERLTIEPTGEVLLGNPGTFFGPFSNSAVLGVASSTSNTYDSRLRLTAGSTDSYSGAQGASIDLHGNDTTANSGILDLVGGASATGSSTAIRFYTNTNSTTQRLSAVLTGNGTLGIGEADPEAESTLNKLVVRGRALIKASAPELRLQSLGGSSQIQQQMIFETHHDQRGGGFRWELTGDPNKESFFGQPYNRQYLTYAFTSTGENIETDNSTAVKFKIRNSDGFMALGNHTPTQRLDIDGGLRLREEFRDASNQAGSNGQVLSSTGTGTLWTSLSSFGSLADTDENTRIQLEESSNDDTIRFDAAGVEVATVNSSTFTLYNVSAPAAPKSTESHANVTSSFVTIADISSWNLSSIDLRSMTVAPASVNGGLHLLADANTTTIGIVVSDATPLVGNLATAYWIYSLEGGVRIRMIRAEFQLSGNDLQVRYTSRRFVGETSVPPANQTDAYLSTAGSPSTGTTLPEVVIEYYPLAVPLAPFFVADNNNARVGINTANPTHSLTVSGTAHITGALHDSSGDAGTDGQVLSTTGTQTNWVAASSDSIEDADGNTQIQVEEGANDDTIRFDTNGSERMTIESNGNVGIGLSTAPTNILHINGQGRASNAAWATTSDARIKHNIEDYTNGLAELLQVRPVAFQYTALSGNSDLEEQHVGIIAQEIEGILPGTIDIIDDSRGSSGLSDLRLFNAGELTFTLINAIKELNAKNEALAKENDSLKAALEALVKRVEQLEEE